MRIAILTNQNEVFVEFKEPVFRELLKTYLAKNDNDVDLTMDQIDRELKELTITK